MRHSILKEKLYQYSKLAGLKIEDRHREGIEYIPAQAGSIYLQTADPRIGRKYALMANSGDGTISVTYGYVSADTMYGYLDGLISNIAKSNVK